MIQKTWQVVVQVTVEQQVEQQTSEKAAQGFGADAGVDKLGSIGEYTPSYEMLDRVFRQLCIMVNNDSDPNGEATMSMETMGYYGIDFSIKVVSKTPLTFTAT